MESYTANPWESIRLDSPTEQINEPQEIFNNIKLDDFPFLRSHLSSIDYLIRCKICDVIVLPESLRAHYETRHSGVDLKSKNDAALLPYRAISHYHHMLDTANKKDHLPSKRNRAPIKRSKRTKHPTLQPISSIECISETDSLSSCTDDPSKLVSSNASEDEPDRLREPVLLKLAKADGYSRHFDCKATLPKIEEDDRNRSDRSVWSVVYGKKLMELNTPSGPTLISRSSLDDTDAVDIGVNLTMDSTSRKDVAKTSIEPLCLSSPSLSPHIPSPDACNVSDEVNSTGATDGTMLHRCMSRSSTYSSSSSGFEFNADKIVLTPNSSKHSISGHFSSFSTSASVKDNPYPIIPSKLPVIGEQDLKIHPHVSSSVVHNQSVIENLTIPATRSSNDHRILNGYHTCIRNFPFIQKNKQLDSTPCKPLKFSSLRKNRSITTIMGNRSPNSSDTPGQSKCLNTYGTESATLIQNAVSDPTVGRMAFPSCRSRGSSGSLMKSATRDVESLIPSIVFDPLTQCGCLGPDGMLCRNSLLCTLHKMEQKRRVPRPKDLRTLVRELRGRLQLARSQSFTNKSISLQLPSACRKHPTLPPGIIDLTDDSNPVSRSSMDNAADDTIHNAAVDSARSVQAQEIPTKDPYTFCATEHSLMNENTLIHPPYPSRLSNRLLNNEANLSNPNGGLRGTMMDRQFAKTCPNITIGNSGDPFVALRQQSNLRSNQVGALHSGQIPNKFISLSSRYPSGMGMTSVLNNRKVVRTSTKRSRSSHSAISHWPSAYGAMRGSFPANLNPSSLIGTNQPSPHESIVQSVNLIPGSSHIIADLDGSFSTAYSDMHDSVLGSPVLPQSPYGTLGLTNDQLTSAYPHSMFAGAQVIREPQSRVIVDDVHEKSITGRSRKSVKSVYRQSAPIFPNANFGTVVPSRYRQNVVPPVSAYLTSSSKHAVGLVPMRSVSCRTLAGCSTADLFSNYDPCRIVRDETSGGTMYPFITPNQPQSVRIAPVHGQRSQLGKTMVPSLSGFSDPTAVPNSMHVDPIEFDTHIQTSLYPSKLSADTSALTVSEPSPIVLPEPYPSCSFTSPPTPRWVPSTARESGVSTSRKNRYFVIRPNALTRTTPSFLLRTRRSETSSFQDSVPTANSQEPSTSASNEQQQSLDPTFHRS